MKRALRPLVLLFSFASLLSCQEGGGLSSEAFDPQSLSEGLNALLNASSYSLRVDKNGEYLETHVYRDAYFGSYKEGSEKESLFAYLEDEGGIFTYESYLSSYVSSPYLEGEDGTVKKGLKDAYEGYYFTGKSYKSFASLDPSLESLTISEKAFRMDFLRAIGLKASDIVSISDVAASFSEGSLVLEATLGEDAYKVVAGSFGSAFIGAVDDYLASGGTAYKPEGAVSSFVSLMKSDDYISDVYDMNEEGYVAYEVYNPHYFLSQYLSSAYGSGLLEITENASMNKGSYLLVASGSLDAGYTGVSVTTTAPYSTEEVEVAYHYPSYLKVVSSPQYLIKEDNGLHMDGYTFQGDVYSFKEKSLLLDFASNFSLDQTWDVATYVPSKVYIDVKASLTTSESEVTFVYCFADSSASYVYPIHFRSFGASSIDLLDKAYQQYNQ